MSDLEEHESEQARILEMAEGCERNGVEIRDLIREKFNCKEADVDKDGDVWIADPQHGHWLDYDKLTELANWIEEQG